jgi:ABC-type antimicrobial peptide transport system permease subunit
MREIGIKAALGAGTSTLLVMVMREVVGYVGVGVIVGATIAAVITQIVGDIVCGVRPTNPAIVFVSSTFILSTACAAGFGAAVHASRVDSRCALKEL